jgi:effector-binding domain-containing protein
MGRLQSNDVMLMPIGRFARASRLSIKSLRNYDDTGLLPAAFVDSDSGYRYYRLEQLRRAETIRSLRALDVPLVQIAQILAGDESDETLTLHLVALADQRDEYDRKLHELQRLMTRKEFTLSSAVVARPVPAQLAATSRIVTTQKTVFVDIPAGFGRVLTALGTAEIDPVGAPFTTFYQAPDADSAGDIALCIPIGGTVRAIAGIEVVEFAGGMVASVIHHGSYEDMGGSYAAISTWIQQHGHRIVGPTREIYLNSPAEVDEDGLLTEIQFPIDPDSEQDGA